MNQLISSLILHYNLWLSIPLSVIFLLKFTITTKKVFCIDINYHKCLYVLFPLDIKYSDSLRHIAMLKEIRSLSNIIPDITAIVG